MARCLICEYPTSGSLEFCKDHYAEYKEEIKEKRPWIRELKNDSQRERRRNKKEFENVSLDAIVDNEYSHNNKDRY